MKKLIFLPIFILALAFFHKSARAEVTFPIAALGNCTSKETCKTFCDLPANRQTCLAYSQSQKLFEAKNSLNCKDLGSCRDFCARPENRTKCDEFMHRLKNVAKPLLATPSASLTRALFRASQEELGCDSEEACTAFCTQTPNILRCQNFLRRHTLWKEEKVEKPATPPGLLRPKPLTNAAPQ